MGRASRAKAVTRAMSSNMTTSSVTSELPDVTVSAKLVPADATNDYWMAKGGATSPDPSPEDLAEPYAKGTVELADKWLQGKLLISPRTAAASVVVICFMFVCWLYIQDNAAARLKTWADIGWFWLKALQPVLAAVAALLFLAVILRREKN